jgi:hypothetical protein
MAIESSGPGRHASAVLRPARRPPDRKAWRLPFGRWGALPPAAALLLACGLGLGLLAGAGSVARAQGPDKPAKTPVLPEPLIPEAIRELVARLSDAEVRQLLIAQLDRVAAPAASAGTIGAGMMPEAMAGRMDTLRSRAAAVLASVPRLPNEMRAAIARFSEGRSAHHLALVTLLLVVMGLAGGAGEWLARRLLAPVRHGLEAAPAAGFWAQGGTLLLRALLDLVGLVVFVAVALAMFLLVYQGTSRAGSSSSRLCSPSSSCGWWRWRAGSSWRREHRRSGSSPSTTVPPGGSTPEWSASPRCGRRTGS